MTMDIHQRSLRTEVAPSFHPSVRVSPEKTPSTPSPSPITDLPSAAQKPAKRSFDVAFLMAPDDLSTKKRQQQQQLRLVTSASLIQQHSPSGMSHAPTLEPMELKISRSLNQQRILSGRPNFSDLPLLPTSPLGLLIPSPKDFQKVDYDLKEPIIDMTQDEQNLQFAKSAFTKVKSVRGDFNTPGTPASPASVSSTMSGGGVSPDVSYQESLSPPMLNSSSSPVNYLQPSKPLNPNMAYFASGGKILPPVGPGGAYFFNSSREKPGIKPTSPIAANGYQNNYSTKHPIDSIQKLRPMLYQGEGLPYSGLPVTSYPFPPNFPPPGGSVPAHTLLTAAASVTAAALLPSSLAALTLPAQNVCAKCKISFRMTSDLVYHMRSHHKGEHMVADTSRRRRDQDKLRCPVCNETFRERHHLTRHMTAHQDKEGDHDDEDDALELTKRRMPHHK